MNNSRRKRINESLLALKESQAKLDGLLNDERNAQECLPHDDEYVDIRDSMDDIISGLEDTLTSLEEAIDTLDNADF